MLYEIASVQPCAIDLKKVVAVCSPGRKMMIMFDDGTTLFPEFNTEEDADQEAERLIQAINAIDANAEPKG